jgi:hypothetical protein
MKKSYALKAKIWKWQGESAWHFLTVGKKESAEIKEESKRGARRGFGSIPVTVKIGKTTFKTSIFPTKEGLYLLPVKASVRNAEDLVEGDTISYTIHLK